MINTCTNRQESVFVESESHLVYQSCSAQFTKHLDPLIQVTNTLYLPSKQPLCWNMAAVCFCWCEAHIYSGHAHKQGEQPQCSRAAWQVVQNVLTVHSRWLDLTKTDKVEISRLEPFLLHFLPERLHCRVN